MDDARAVSDMIDTFTNHTLTLKEYQLIGLQFFIDCLKKKHGTILADEMGLGKTCQAVAFLVYLTSQVTGKAKTLVICPLSVIDHWKDEIQRFGCSLKLLIYYGKQEEREKIIKLVNEVEWNVLLTIFEMPLRDTSFFQRLCWNCCIVDEGHRLKNAESLLHTVLKELKIDHFILLTGTPVQNNLDELYSLLSFTEPIKFSPAQKEHHINKFKFWKDNDPDRLRQYLGDYMLRRTKEFVCDLPEMNEVILYHGLSLVQRNLYVAILMKNLGLVDKSLINKQKLLNTLMQLRKCVSHPYLFEGIEPEPFEEGDHLIFNSGKLIVLDALLTYLFKTGHKVLIFSQMVRVLDIIQDYLSYKDYSYERLDGSVRGEERYASIKRFNKNRETFCFLLSTRAGGLGLTLTSADTVVFLDSDFNPQNDIQAAARAHRIGQDKPVKVIRLIARDSVEEYILQRAYSKLQLTNVVLSDNPNQNASTLSTAEISDILMHGLAKLNDEANEKSANFKMDETELVGLIGRSNPVTGQWEKPPKKDVALNLPENVDLYDYKGENYRKYRESDATAFDALAAKYAETKEHRKTDQAKQRFFVKNMELNPEELERQKQNLEARRLEREEKKQKRTEAAESARKAMWEENNYKSSKILEMEDVDESESQSSEASSKSDINYLIGDVTDPPFDEGPALIVHCLDNSGEWGSGGVFDALKNKFPEIDEFYSNAELMKDLNTGDVHIFKPKNENYVQLIEVALAITQDSKHRDTMNYKFLDWALNKLGKFASKHKYSVHLPRIGYGSLKFNWYSIERLIRKYLCDRCIPTYVYYYKRKQQKKQNVDFPGSTAFDESFDKNYDTPCQSAKKQKIDNFVALDNSIPVNDPPTNEEPSKNLTDLFTGFVFCFRKCSPDMERRLGRLITAYDGHLEFDDTDPDITHIIIQDDHHAEDASGKTLVSVSWVEKCIKMKTICP